MRTAAVLQAFRDVAPQTPVMLLPLQRSRTSAHPALRRFADVDLVVTGDPPSDERLQHVVAYTEPRVAAVSRRSELADADELACADVLSLPFPDLGGVDPVASAFYCLDAERGGPARTAGAPCEPEVPAMLRHVAAGGVMTFGAETALHFRHDDVAFVPLPDAPDPDVYVVWETSPTQQRPLSPPRRGRSAARSQPSPPTRCRGVPRRWSAPRRPRPGRFRARRRPCNGQRSGTGRLRRARRGRRHGTACGPGRARAGGVPAERPSGPAACISGVTSLDVV